MLVSSALLQVRSFLSQRPLQPLLAIIGPTASGKTALSIAFAVALRHEGVTVEILNADSRQLYRGFDIGTAKITPREMQGVPHHLLSVLDPEERTSIAWYQQVAEEAIASIRSRGALPLLVGGSMLYVSSIVDGLVPLPSDPLLRSRLEDAYDRDSGESLYHELKTIDPVSAASMSSANKRYVLRALEIAMLHGEPKSVALSSKPPSHDTLLLGINPPKDTLDRAITQRVHAMIEAGWIQEVRALLGSGIPLNAPAMQSHGYREIAGWLDSGADAALLPALLPKIASASKRYAKRHRTWWKHDERVRWL